jgi:hypothetical protein
MDVLVVQIEECINKLGRLGNLSAESSSSVAEARLLIKDANASRQVALLYYM